MLDEKSVPQRKSTQVRPFLLGFLAAVSIAAVVFVLWQQFGQPPAATHPAPLAAEAHPASQSLAAVLAEETSKLDLKPHSIVSTTDKAMSAADALRQGDHRAADALAREVLAHSKLQPFSFQPFNRFVDHLSQGDDAQFLDGLNSWISADKKSAMAYLLRAKYYKETAWLVRGADFRSSVTDARWRGFKEYLGRAEGDVRQSMAIDPDIPSAYSLWLEVMAGEGDAQKLDSAFRESIAHFPGYYDLYRIRLHYLEPKWGGSAGAMYQFVNQYAGSVPESSPLKLLYMQLSANLLNSASVECRPRKHEALTACIETYMNRYVTGGLTDGVTKALSLYKISDPIQYSNALWPILGGMVSSGGDSTSINTVLQLAADAMGSENQLIHEPGHNNYVLDDITARIWAKLGNPANVEQKFKEALDDVERMSFPNEDEKDAVLAAVYEDMTWVARAASQYAKVIAYHDAANTVAGMNHGGSQYLKCFAYYKLNHFEETVDECTALIKTHRDKAEAHYYRARAFESLKQYDAAIAEFTPIADDGSEHLIRTAAAIEIEHMNALRGNYAGELEIFKRYPFLFDASLQEPDDLAIAFNNRCFAYMKLGRLQEALDDCTTSLRYGRLPDALQKQQQLLKMLKASTTT
jgi:tetratricopeptide (TPR) repeat protein